MPRAARIHRKGTKAAKKYPSMVPPGGKRLLLLISSLCSLCLGGEFLSGCGQEPPPPPPAAPEPELPAIGAVEPPEAVRIDEEKLVEIPPPARPGPLRWDFSPGRLHRYEISQRLNQVTVVASGAAREVTRSEDRNAGLFVFAAAGDGTALARLKIRTQSSLINGKPARREDIEKHPPAGFECRVREDGIPDSGARVSGASDPRLFLDILLALQEGERASPEGKVRTRLTGHFKVERCDCARLESEFELAPALSSGRTLLRGRSVAYFAVRERRFVRAEMSVAQAMRSKGRTPEGAWVTRSTDLETVLRLRPVE